MPSTNRRRFLAITGSMVATGIGGCLDATTADGQESTTADTHRSPTDGQRRSPTENDGQSTSEQTTRSTTAQPTTTEPQTTVTPTTASASTKLDESIDQIHLPSAVSTGDLPDDEVPLRVGGSVTFLNFFATWCKPCQREMPALVKLRDAYEPAQLHMVSITSESDEAAIRDFWDEYDATWPVVMDPELVATDHWGVNAYPTNMLFDERGQPASGNDPKIAGREFDIFDRKVSRVLNAE